MALHFWYSSFMPAEYRLQLSAILLPFLQQCTLGNPTVALGPRSKLSTIFPQEVAEIFSHFVSSSLSIGDIQDEYDRVRTAPSRRDFRDRMYLTLKPAHRVAFQEFRRFGIVLPFGALNAHFNCPNLSLFSSGGKWMQTDYADPLEGWESVPISRNLKAYQPHCDITASPPSLIQARHTVPIRRTSMVASTFSCHPSFVRLQSASRHFRPPLPY
jgi:hypothetical protein